MNRKTIKLHLAGVLLAAAVTAFAFAMVSCGGDANTSDDIVDAQTSNDSGVDAVTSATRYVCTVCQYVYDPAQGDPTQGVPAGTAFGDLPENWTCPDCGAAQSAFEPQE